MKKTLLLMAMLGMFVFVSCGDDDPIAGEPDVVNPEPDSEPLLLKTYTLNVDRGYLPTGIPLEQEVVTVEESEAGEYTFIPAGNEGEYYLYCVSNEKFVRTDDFYSFDVSPYLDMPNGTFTLDSLENGRFLIVSTETGHWLQFGQTTRYPYWLLINYWNTIDEGNQWTLTEKGEADFAEVEKRLQEYAKLDFIYTSISDTACVLSSCRNMQLEDVVVPGEVEIDGQTHKVTVIGASAFDRHPNLKTVKLPDTVERIEYEAFGHCPNLESIDLGQGLLETEDNIVIECDKLQELVIPDKTTYVGNGVNAFCQSMTTVVYGKSMKRIGADIFTGLRNLEKVVCRSTAPPVVGYWGTTRTSATLYVPKGSLEQYKQSDVWRNFIEVKEFE